MRNTASGTNRANRDLKSWTAIGDRGQERGGVAGRLRLGRAARIASATATEGLGRGGGAMNRFGRGQRSGRQSRSRPIGKTRNSAISLASRGTSVVQRWSTR